MMAREASRPLLTPAWSGALTDWSEAQSASGIAASTLAKRLKQMTAFAKSGVSESPWQVGAAQLVEWVARQGWSAKTATTHRSTLRTFYQWAHTSGRMPANPALTLSSVNTGADSSVERPPGVSGPLRAHVPAVWARAIDMFSREQQATGRAAQTVALRRAHLAKMARGLSPLEPFDVGFYDLIDWLSTQTTWAAETRRSMRSTLRSFYEWAHTSGFMTVNPAARLPMVKSTSPNPHPASETAVHFAVLTATPRERLMVRLAAEIGLRRAEVACVHSRDMVQQDAGWSLIVHGKGSKDRVIPLPGELASELRNLEPGWAFPSRTGSHLSARYVGLLVRRLLPPGVSMHALRHRFATRAYGLANDVFAVQQLLGHASPETTRRYVAISDDTLRSTVDLLAATTTRASIGAAR